MWPKSRSPTADLHRKVVLGETGFMATPTVDDHFEIVTSTAFWMAKQRPYRVPRTPLIQAGAAALANAIATHDDSMTLSLETRCRQHVRRAIRDLITDRFEV
ncbi:MAG: hypothetical protein CMJ54_05155 [Planctomycetaceae bacterium]|nr:hypothetical protein [Planctomycetaceae bacterium]